MVKDKKQLYRIKMSESLDYSQSPNPISIKDGYLTNNDEFVLLDEIEANKTANFLFATIEPYGKAFTATELKVLQLPKSELSEILLNQLEGQEAFGDNDTNLSEKFYYGDVFQTIQNENFETDTVLDDIYSEPNSELEVLVALAKDYEYVMLIS